MNQPFVLLVHGLHMNGLYMRPLAKKLAQAGFDSHAPTYHSLTQPIDRHSERLHHWLTRHHDPAQPIHLVGHSLGGLVIRHFLATYGSDWQIGRCVTLGTPHTGSICANYANRLLPPLVHKAYPNALDGACVPPPEGVPFGVIAGTRSLGLGLPLLTYHSRRYRLDPTARTNDGTVYLSETPLVGASDYLVLPVSHTELLIDQQTADEVVSFLKYGRFGGSTQII